MRCNCLKDAGQGVSHECSPQHCAKILYLLGNAERARGPCGQHASLNKYIRCRQA